METHTLKIKGGKVTLSVDGIKGAGCRQATEGIERALGLSVNTTDTPEMYESASQTQDSER